MPVGIGIGILFVLGIHVLSVLGTLHLKKRHRHHMWGSCEREGSVLFHLAMSGTVPQIHDGRLATLVAEALVEITCGVHATWDAHLLHSSGSLLRSARMPEIYFSRLDVQPLVKALPAQT